jgi:conjugative relaxase-like TrwC/TraI family protein
MSSEGAKSYFVRSDYLSEGQELVGEWRGAAAEMLGLRGTVDKESFDQLCDNINPQTGEPLTAVTREGRRVGFDLTWSAPKSISVVHALTGDSAILDAFRDSIHETMDAMEKEMAARVRKGGQDVDRTTGNWAVAEFVHLTSRPVDGVACPQLHLHAFTFNATYDSVEDQWKAGQFGDIKRDAYYWQAVQQARFANKLQHAGYSIKRTKDAFEIDGIPKSALDKFSLRTKQIEDEAKRLAERAGVEAIKAEGKARLGATTRERKNDRYSYDELVEIWNKRLEPEERAAIAEAFHGKKPGKPLMRNAVHAQYAVEHSFERSSVVEERRLLTLGLRHGCGEVTPEGIKAEADRCKLLKRIEDGRTWVTTREVLKEESRMIDFAVSGKATMRPLSAAPDISSLADGLTSTARGSDQRDTATLSPEQQAVIRHVLTSQDRVVMVRGAAGTGKSTLTRSAVRQIDGTNHHVVMLAPTTQAVDVLNRDGHDAHTVAEFLVSQKVYEKAKGGVIWVDEASLVGTKTMASLFDAAKELNARVVLMGDKRQMGSIERGSALRVLETIAKLPVAELSDIKRQAGEYREAVKLFSKGRATEGFDKLDSLGWVKPMNSYEQVAKDYADKIQYASKPDDAAVIVCPTHREGAKVTEAVRNEMKDRGVISEDEHEFLQLVSCQWTEAQRGDKEQYTGEEMIRFTQRGGGHEAGDTVKASEMDLAALKASRFTTFNERRIRVSKGDMIRVTGNGRTKDGHRLRNGAVYRVDGFSRNGGIVLDNGWTVEKDFGLIAHAYVSTYFAAQGRTTDHAIVVQGSASLPAVNQEGLYVAASRGRKSCTLYSDNVTELREAIHKNRERLSATELIAKPKPQLTTRFKKAMAKAREAFVAAKRAAYELTTKPKERDYAFER